MTTTDEQAIRQVLDTYMEALNTSDADLAASVYADDGVFMPDHIPTSSGTDMVRKLLCGTDRRSLPTSPDTHIKTSRGGTSSSQPEGPSRSLRSGPATALRSSAHKSSGPAQRSSAGVCSDLARGPGSGCDRDGR